MLRLSWVLVALVAFTCCGCATYSPAIFPVDGSADKGPPNEYVVREAATVRVTLASGRIEEGKVVSVGDDYLVLANEADENGRAREFQKEEIELVEVRSTGLSDTGMIVSIAGVSALVAIISLSTFEEPDS